jgi:hypothetical protein
VIEAANQHGDGFGEDIVIQKIIYYVGLFKQEVKESLKGG